MDYTYEVVRPHRFFLTYFSEKFQVLFVVANFIKKTGVKKI